MQYDLMVNRPHQAELKELAKTCIHFNPKDPFSETAEAIETHRANNKEDIIDYYQNLHPDIDGSDFNSDRGYYFLRDLLDHDICEEIKRLAPWTR